MKLLRRFTDINRVVVFLAILFGLIASTYAAMKTFETREDHKADLANLVTMNKKDMDVFALRIALAIRRVKSSDVDGTDGPWFEHGEN